MLGSSVFLLAATFPDYPVRGVKDCAVSASKGSITIGLQPLEDLKEQKEYFDTALTPKGFVPVFVVIQNASNGDSVLFDKTKLTYGAGEVTLSGSPEARINKPIYFLTGGGVFTLNYLSNVSKVQQNLLKKELQSKTLSAGTSANGFLYVPVPKNAPRQKISLHVPVTRAGTDETVIVDLVF